MNEEQRKQLLIDSVHKNTIEEVLKVIDDEWKEVCKSKRDNERIYVFKQLIKNKIKEIGK